MWEEIENIEFDNKIVKFMWKEWVWEWYMVPREAEEYEHGDSI